MSNVIKKDAKQLTNTDIAKWASGDLETAQPLTDRAVADEIIRRRNLEADQSIDAVKAVILGKAPKAEEEVVDEAPTQDAEVTESKTEAAAPAPAAKQEAAPAPVKKDVSKKVDRQATAGGSEEDLAIEIIEQNLRDYVARMAPNVSHTAREGTLNQVKLYRILQMVLRQRGRNFNRAYGFLLNFINDHRSDAFHERYVYRYFDTREMKRALPAGDRRKFERLINLLITTCNPKTRSRSMEQVDIDATLAPFKDQEMHQRVAAFYQGL